ncbi:MAG TPA: hypothetical protein PKK48_06780, partial [Phycisphaerae bacterium]|nr:hypothetical protein [Phycisphaerae bacterium]
MMSLTEAVKAESLKDETLKRMYSMNKEEQKEAAGHVMIGGGTRGGPILHHGKGVHVRDTDGKKYVDCT